MANDYVAVGSPEREQARERAVNLFTFLKEFIQLRMKSVRSVGEYPEVFWFHDLPHEHGCTCAAWNLDRERTDQDAWLEIHKPRLIPPPSPPSELKPWLKEEDLNNSSLEMPELREEITVPIPSEEGEGPAETRFERPRLEDHPEIQALWDGYVEDQWWPWAENDRRLQKIQKAYTSLFVMHQRQQRLGEQFEVVLGLGLLSWRTPSGHDIKRHLLVANTNIGFDAAKGFITVGPAGEGAKPRLEQEMLEPSERPDPDQQHAIEEEVSHLDDEIWDSARLKSILSGWAHAISDRGEFSPDLDRSANDTNDPKVRLAPALILRPRNERSYVTAFDTIVRQLQSDSVLPSGLARYVVSPEEREQHEPPTPVWTNPGDGEVYFPLEANEAQRRIIERLVGHDGVVVQGPPGTGKSHTIVNLICHLLATGNRVLVTSHTARALQVLRRFIRERMPDISPLSVVLLGDNRDSLEAMETSVLGIVDRHNNWDLEHNTREIRRLEADLSQARETEAKLLNEVRAIRERETYQHPPRFGSYAGTLQQIGTRLHNERETYSWVIDRPAEDAEPPLSNEEFADLLALLKDEKVGKPQTGEPFDPQHLPTPEEFRWRCENEKNAKNNNDETREGRQRPAYPRLLGASSEVPLKISQELDHLLGEIDRLDSSIHAWVKPAVREILGDRDRPWRELLETTKRYCAVLAEGAPWADRTPVTGRGDRDYHVVKADAEDLLRHLEQGGGWGIGPFRPAVVKRAGYLRDQIQVKGRPCDSVQVLRDLLSWLDVAIQIEELRRLWAPWEQASATTFTACVRKFEDLCEPLEAALKLYDRVGDLKLILTNDAIAPQPTWHDVDSLHAFRQAVAAAIATLALRNIENIFRELVQVVASTAVAGAPGVIPQLRQAVEQRDVGAYREAYSILERMWRLHGLLQRLKAAAPQLSESVLDSIADPAWDKRGTMFDLAWNWARASAWIDRLADPREEERLRVGVDTERQRIRQALERIASAKAWHWCLTRMTDSQRQHLIAWSNAVRRIGRGTGRQAPHHRREAQRHMEQCRGAIPAWIMPLYRVAESVKPAPNTFDVAIIDEASQSGPEALLLPYLAKKIIVVGDDKQISPEFVGIERDNVIALRRRYINELPHRDQIGVDSSFFDLANTIFAGRIRLREHYRCMPEIIQFSNTLCYLNEPLTPLRQYGSSRLPPIVTRYVENGYREGSDSNVVNPPEAQNLVECIVKCCKEEAYRDKTFGVISLLGQRQAQNIEKLLIDRLGPEEMEKRQLVCGDAYAFQGDERDVMFLSLVVAPTEGRRIATLTTDNHKRRFNVAASRARDQLFLFHSVALNDLSSQCVRYALLNHCLQPNVGSPTVADLPVEDLRRIGSTADREQTRPPSPFESWFELDVALRIAERGFRVIPQFEIAGYRIDLVVEGMERRLAVECDGDRWHGPDRYLEDMTRQRMLERCGWHFWRVRGSAFAVDPEKAMESLWETLRVMQIRPSGARYESEQNDESLSCAENIHDVDPGAPDRPSSIGDENVIHFPV